MSADAARPAAESATQAPDPSAGQTTTAPGSVLVIGAGPAGFATARELRRRGWDGELTLVDPEGLPYDRPPLSKDYLTGDTEAHRLLFAPPPWFEEHRVRVVTGRVARLELPDGAGGSNGPDADGPDVAPGQPCVVLDDGTQRLADVVVLAPGGRPRPLDVPGGDHPDVIALRTRADADRLAGHLRFGARVVVVGAGFTGSEVASSARERLADVTLVTAHPRPAELAVGAALAERLHALHAAHGVEVLEGRVGRIEHASGGTGLDGAHRVHVRAADGAEHALDADVVVAAIGIVPDLTLAEAAGIATDRGILVDGAQRTSHPAVYAVGDAAQRRAETAADVTLDQHWEPAMRSGAAAAAAILGEDAPADGAPWFWSDRHGVHVEGAGVLAPPPGGRAVHREVRGVVVASFALDAGGRMTGAASVDDPMAVKAARRIIDRGVVVDPERLADPEVPVKALLRG